MMKAFLYLTFTAAGLLRADADTDWIRRLGGKVELDGAGRIVAVNLSRSWVNDTEILRLAALPALERLDLSHTRISDEGLLHLRPARQIRDLNLLYAEQITDLGLNAVKGWTKLKRLNVRGTRISDPTLAIVGQLHQLESLDIANTGITDKGLDSLVPLTQLKHLALGRPRFSQEALSMLRLLTTLESLDLSGPSGLARTQRSERGGVPPGIGELKELRVLRLGHSVVDAEDLRSLAESLPKLEKLGLEACTRVDDAALKVIAGWKSLRYVDVQDTKATRAGVDELKRARPDVVVLSGPFTQPKPAAATSGQNTR